MTLSPDETRRYARHLVLRDVGGAGQQRLAAARVVVVGAGGLGSPVIAYLAAAGVGTIGVIDDDAVSLSNLQRQIVHRVDDIGVSKVASAQRFAGAINPHVRVVAHEARLDAGNARGLIAGYDLVLDGSDNFETRRLVAQAAAELKLPLVAGAVSMWDGQLTVFMPGGRSFADLYPVTPEADDVPSCEAVGVLGPVTGVIGTLMAMEAIKLIVGAGEILAGRVMLYDGRSARFTELAF